MWEGYITEVSRPQLMIYKIMNKCVVVGFTKFESEIFKTNKQKKIIMWPFLIALQHFNLRLGRSTQHI